MTTALDPAAKAEIARRFIEAIPHARALGMRLTEIGDGVAAIEMDYDPRFVGDPQTGVIHGGAVSALMDTCGGAAVMSHPQAARGHRDAWTCASTTCAPRRPASASRARATCYHITRSVAFVRATATDDDDRPAPSPPPPAPSRVEQAAP